MCEPWGRQYIYKCCYFHCCIQLGVNYGEMTPFVFSYLSQGLYSYMQLECIGWGCNTNIPSLLWLHSYSFECYYNHLTTSHLVYTSTRSLQFILMVSISSIYWKIKPIDLGLHMQIPREQFCCFNYETLHGLLLSTAHFVFSLQYHCTYKPRK